jgi:hypothetical protein
MTEFHPFYLEEKVIYPENTSFQFWHNRYSPVGNCIFLVCWAMQLRDAWQAGNNTFYPRKKVGLYPETQVFSFFWLSVGSRLFRSACFVNAGLYLRML